MKANRRRFLSLLGVGTAAGPLAAKAAVEQEMLSLTSIKGMDYLSVGNAANSYPAECGQQIGKEPYKSPYQLAEQYLRLGGKLPSFVEQNVRERAKTVQYLDPDIACKRSWSLNVKIAAQRERNYTAELNRYIVTGKYEAAQSTFQKLTGFQWPW